MAPDWKALFGALRSFFQGRPEAKFIASTFMRFCVFFALCIFASAAANILKSFHLNALADRTFNFVDDVSILGGALWLLLEELKDIHAIVAGIHIPQARRIADLVVAIVILLSIAAGFFETKADIDVLAPFSKSLDLYLR
jgi:hypothetical protein